MGDSNEVQGKDPGSGRDETPRVDHRTEQDGSLKVHGDKLERLIPREREGEEHASGGESHER